MQEANPGVRSAAPFDNENPHTVDAVSVGLVLSSPGTTSPAGTTLWGECVPADRIQPYARDGTSDAAGWLKSVEDVVAPALTGLEITSFRELDAISDALTQEVRVPEPAPTGTGPKERDVPPATGGYSRRDLLAAPLRFLKSDASAEQIRGTEEPSVAQYITVRRPLVPGIRYGISQALLRAVAWSQNVTAAEVIADEWSLSGAGASVSLQVDCAIEERAQAEAAIALRADSLGQVMLPRTGFELGEDGGAPVRYVRWLRGRLDALQDAAYRPTIHIDLRGALGRLYDNDLGRVLGYLHRLESAAEAYSIRVEDPISMESRTEQIEALRTLREYIDFRGMDVPLTAHQWVETFDDVQAFVDAEAVDAIRIRMAEQGGIASSVEAILAGQAQGVGILLGDSCFGTDLSARMATQVAVAVEPDVYVVGLGPSMPASVVVVRNEMARAEALTRR